MEKRKDPIKRQEYVKEYNRTHRAECNARKLKWAKAHPERLLLKKAKERAVKNGLDFSIEESDIFIPEVCPVLGIKLITPEPGIKGEQYRFNSWSSPSLDRIDNTKGYVKGNVCVISWRANHLKNDGSLNEMRAIVTYMEKNQ